MRSSLSIFINWFKEYYRHEFRELSIDFKNKWIEEIIENNGEYISQDYVKSKEEDLCQRCGLCCENQFKECEFFNQDTKLCMTHDNQPWDVCRLYPYGELGMIAPLTLNCRYQVRIFISFLNEFFTECLNRGDECEQ